VNARELQNPAIVYWVPYCPLLPPQTLILDPWRVMANPARHVSDNNKRHPGSEKNHGPAHSSIKPDTFPSSLPQIPTIKRRPITWPAIFLTRIFVMDLVPAGHSDGRHSHDHRSQQRSRRRRKPAHERSRASRACDRCKGYSSPICSYRSLELTLITLN
jgi:hypothetical protein